MKKYILAIDQGTTGSTAILYDFRKKSILASKNIEFRQIYPKPSWVEHDLNEIWLSIQESVSKVIKNIDQKEILGIGITNQRETTCVFDNSGKPLHNAIVWQDRRTQNHCVELKEHSLAIKEKTGLPIDPYFSATKMKWLKDNLKTNNYLFGTIDTFVLYKLTQGKSYFTDASNASRTMLMNINSNSWDQELLTLFGISENQLPIIKDTFGDFGQTQGLGFLQDGIPITCLIGDQQSALLGQAGVKEKSIKCTYGTGAFVLQNTGRKRIDSSSGLLTTSFFQYQGTPYYALEGSTYIAGAAVQFLRDNFQFIEKSSDIEVLASKADLENCQDLYFFPFFTGIGTPHWNSDAKACIYGMTRGTSISEISRACLEGIALSINDLFNTFNLDSRSSISEVRVDGGGCANNLLLQLQANFSETKVVRPKNIESTAFGAIMGSLIGLDEINLNNIEDFWQIEKEIVMTKGNENYYQNKKKTWTTLCKKIFE
jgi:glycerol kinase